MKVSDRVRRANGAGCQGVIKDIRTETISSASETKDRPIIVTVAWDNGTVSQFAPDGLDPVK